MPTSTRWSDPMVEHVCRRLDCIPLALELAAARAATLGLPAIVSALDDRFSLLSGGRRRAVDRHSTMRATIDWSYRLLDADEQRMFLWLAVFPNGVELDAAHRVAAGLGLDERGRNRPRGLARAQEHVVARSAIHSGSGTACSRRCAPLRWSSSTSAGNGWPRSPRTPSGWPASPTCPGATPCSAAVERHSIRLERESDSWRDAVMLAARVGSGDLAARLCGPPVAFFLLGRHDLADLVAPLLELCGADRRRRRAVLCALTVSASGATDPAALQAWADEMEEIEAVEPTGLGGLMRWIALAWEGDFTSSVDVCVTWSLDLRIGQATRDLFVGIATLDRFSLTDATDDPDGLIDRALEIADRSDVALHRVTCLLGAAWGLAGQDPVGSLRLVRRALNDIDDVPALTRLTLPGSASRLLIRLDPRLAAQGLLVLMDPPSPRRSFVDLIPLFYATTLLQRLGHPSAESALASLSTSPLTPYPSMMDIVDLARQASSSTNRLSLGQLESAVRNRPHRHRRLLPA